MTAADAQLTIQRTASLSDPEGGRWPAILLALGILLYAVMGVRRHLTS